MIPDFSPPVFTQSGPTITLKSFGDLRESLTKINAWVGYATNYIQSQLLPPLNRNVVGIAAPLVQGPSALERIAVLEREIAVLKEKLKNV